MNILKEIIPNKRELYEEMMDEKIPLTEREKQIDLKTLFKYLKNEDNEDLVRGSLAILEQHPREKVWDGLIGAMNDISKKYRDDIIDSLAELGSLELIEKTNEVEVKMAANAPIDDEEKLYFSSDKKLSHFTEDKRLEYKILEEVEDEPKKVIIFLVLTPGPDEGKSGKKHVCLLNKDIINKETVLTFNPKSGKFTGNITLEGKEAESFLSQHENFITNK